MENKNSFFQNNYFVYFTRPKRITTYLNDDGEEKKKLPFDNFSWKNINKDNYKEFVSDDAKSYYIITGKISNITVIDFDDETKYEECVNHRPELKNYFTVKTHRGYHIYFKYNEALPTTSNINKIDGIDCRNDGGIVIAPPTKYKILNGEKTGYKYIGGIIDEIPSSLLNILLPTKKSIKKKKNKNLIMILSKKKS